VLFDTMPVQMVASVVRLLAGSNHTRVDRSGDILIRRMVYLNVLGEISLKREAGSTVRALLRTFKFAPNSLWKTWVIILLMPGRSTSRL